jgi:hypothetical protein
MQAFIDHEHAIKVGVERSNEIAKLVDEYNETQFSSEKPPSTIDLSAPPTSSEPAQIDASPDVQPSEPSDDGSDDASGS